jgi:hypothetical protein
MMPLGAKAGDAWPPDAQARIVEAYQAGGMRGAAAAFPDRSYPAVRSAVRRFALGHPGGPPTMPARSPEEVRAALRALPMPFFVDRLADLIGRKASCDRRATLLGDAA